jgi:hypothetical protein
VNALDRRRHRLRRIAALGFLAAVVDGTAGAALIVVSWVLSAGLGHWLTVVGSALLFSVIPLLMAAAHLMDRADDPRDDAEATTRPAAVLRLVR